MDHHKSERGYNWSVITVVIGVVMAITYLIPQTLREHQIEEDRTIHIERTIQKQQDEIDELENELIKIKEDLNGNQLSPKTNPNQ